MKNSVYLALMCCALACFSCKTERSEQNYVDFVDPYIGSDAHGHVFVGASAPFGMVQAGPNNIYKGWDWCSGYHYSDSIVIGFSHTHMTGGGCGELGDILLMPYPKPETTDSITKHWSSYYSHDKERVTPYYYSLLMENGVNVELTATERTAFHRYEFPDDEIPQIVINLKDGVGDEAIQTELKYIDEHTIGGYRFSKGWCPEHRVYFMLTSDQPIKNLFSYRNDSLKVVQSDSGKGVIGVMGFDKNVKCISLKVSISSVSCQNAIENMIAEIPGWDFDMVMNDTRKKWNDELSIIDVATEDEDKKKVFYTAMYHTLVAPTLYCDVNGEFRGHDKEIHKATWNNYTTFSLWDTYRTLHPLFTFTQMDKVNDMVNSMLGIYDQQGKLPIWPIVGGETNQMPGYSAVPVIADAYLKGFTGFDGERAFEACKNSAMNKYQNGVSFLLEQKFIPCDKVAEATSIGLEYAVDDWGIAAMAKKMNKAKDREYFLERSKYYSLYIDTVIGYARPRNYDGSWLTPYDPFNSVHGGYFCEGTGWQYTFLVPHDPAGLITLLGGEERFVSKLDSLFLVEGDMGAEASIDISGLIGQYAHGNEPSHHIVYLYPYVGQQWKTAEKVRFIQDNFYTSKPDGIIGNEDCGQMSAWYIMSSLGFYQVNPANGVYVFGSPLFDEATVKMSNGNIFNVKAVNNTKKNIYIQSVKLNGVDYPKAYITYNDIIKGGVLEFTMGSKPNTNFGAEKENRPPSAF